MLSLDAIVFVYLIVSFFLLKFLHSEYVLPPPVHNNFYLAKNMRIFHIWVKIFFMR